MVEGSPRNTLCAHLLPPLPSFSCCLLLAYTPACHNRPAGGFSFTCRLSRQRSSAPRGGAQVLQQQTLQQQQMQLWQHTTMRQQRRQGATPNSSSSSSLPAHLLQEQHQVMQQHYHHSKRLSGGTLSSAVCLQRPSQQQRVTAQLQRSRLLTLLGHTGVGVPGSLNTLMTTAACLLALTVLVSTVWLLVVG